MSNVLLLVHPADGRDRSYGAHIAEIVRKGRGMMSFSHRLLAVAISAAIGMPAFAADSEEATAQSAVVQATTKKRNDPLLRFQWHLANQGQKVFGDERPVAGVDLNIGNLHETGRRGAGVIVGVVDDGLEIGHEDLRDNIVPGGSKNFVDGSHDPTPLNGRDGHGTGVAGIVAASGWNGMGGRGVAPEARLKGFNMLSQDIDGIPDQDAAIRYSWGGGQEASDVRVFNNSWGSTPTSYPAISRAEQRSWERLMSSSRGGTGAGVYIKSAGNSFRSFWIFGCPNEEALTYGVSCAHANADSLNNLPGVITVAALRADGKRSSYSSAGSSIWISGFGGEYGLEKAIAGSGYATYAPAVVTTDLSGCERGYNQASSSSNRLDAGSTFDPACNYLAGFNGTSAAAPTVTGVVALMLGENPKLSPRDVKYILAITARQVDASQPRAVYDGVTIDPGWITNAAGHKFSNWYGFGLVDASSAVAVSRSFRSLPRQIDTGWRASQDKPSPIGRLGIGSSMTINVAEKMKVESVQISFATTHTRPENLRAILTSPQGTRSYVLTPFAFVRAAGGFEAKLIASNAFLDEESLGDWTLQVIDVKGMARDTTLENFELRVLGYKS
jgi:subtilisin family serine protease